VARAAVAETWRQVWGDGKFFADQDEFFFVKISILAAKISDDLFYSHRPGF